jgi:outer membrane protein
MKSSVIFVALSLVLGTAPAFAQGTQPPPAQQPAPAQPAASQPAPSPASTAPAPTPPRPFPQGAKFAFVNIQRVAAESGEGKASTEKVRALNQQKVTQLNDMNKKLQADQSKLQTQTSVMSEAARAQLERDIDRQQKEIQRFTQDAQDEVQALQQDLQNTFQQRLLPVIQQIVSERGLEVLFSQNDSGIVWADPALDITADVIKRFDTAAPPTTTGATPPATPSTTPAQPSIPGAKPPAGSTIPPAGTQKPPAGSQKPPQR